MHVLKKVQGQSNLWNHCRIRFHCYMSNECFGTPSFRRVFKTRICINCFSRWAEWPVLVSRPTREHVSSSIARQKVHGRRICGKKNEAEWTGFPVNRPCMKGCILTCSGLRRRRRRRRKERKRTFDRCGFSTEGILFSAFAVSRWGTAVCVSVKKKKSTKRV